MAEQDSQLMDVYLDLGRCEKAVEARRIAAAGWARAISVASSSSTIERLREWSAH